jgi:hypothetical protein
MGKPIIKQQSLHYKELSDGTIKCHGRVGRSLVVEVKPVSKWIVVLKQKLSKTKGYTDVTELSAEPVVGTTPVDNKGY